MSHHVWINPTALNVTQGQVAWTGNVPSKGTLKGYYAACYTSALAAPNLAEVFRKLPILFNDAFGAVFYSESRLFLGMKSSDGTLVIYYSGDLFKQPVSVEEGMTSVDLTTIYPDQITKFARSGETIGGTYFTLGTALLVDVGGA